jgi:hypothetical protein
LIASPWTIRLLEMPSPRMRESGAKTQAGRRDKSELTLKDRRTTTTHTFAANPNGPRISNRWLLCDAVPAGEFPADGVTIQAGQRREFA